MRRTENVGVASLHINVCADDPCTYAHAHAHIHMYVECDPLYPYVIRAKHGKYWEESGKQQRGKGLEEHAQGYGAPQCKLA